MRLELTKRSRTAACGQSHLLPTPLICSVRVSLCSAKLRLTTDEIASAVLAARENVRPTIVAASATGARLGRILLPPEVDISGDCR